MTRTGPRLGVALGGFMGAGKTSVGELLARRLGLPFVDLDAHLAARFGPIAERIATEGEGIFRDRERTAVRELCDGVARVLATGGGTWVDPRNREALAGSYRRVVLAAPLDVLRRRVGAGGGRPLWDEGVAERLAARQAAYADADLVVETGSCSVDQVVEEIAAWIERVS